MAVTKGYVDSKSWLDNLEDLDNNITVTNAGYGATNPGAVTGSVSLNSGAGTGWAYPNTINNGNFTVSSGYANPWATMNTEGKLNLDGKNADLVINGRSLTETIAKLEERLGILVPNPELETECAELKELGDRYRELEKYTLEKLKTFNTLKRYDPN